MITAMDLVFAVVTDLHFGSEANYDGKLRKLTSQADRLARQFVEAVNGTVKPDLVFNLGDDIEDENPDRDRARYLECIRILSGCTGRVIHVAGNHDLINLTEDDLRDIWGHSGPLHHSFDEKGVHFVVLVTRETRDVSVNIDAAQLEWLSRDLERTALPTVVLMHHVASEQDLTDNRWFSRAPHLCRVEERRALRSVLAASKKVLAVFNGHAHWNHFDLCDGIPFFTVQSLTENIDDDAPGRPAAAYAVCRLSDERLIVEVRGNDPARYQIEIGTAAAIS
jgi:3',5'-cyclic-AMP phosphodiesterase